MKTILLSLCFLAATLASPRSVALEATIHSQPDGATMILIPAGEFIYGADRQEILSIEKRLHAPWDDRINPSEFPKTRRSLPDFYIDKYDVTNEQYNAFVVALHHRASRYRKYPQLNGARQPVVGVGWGDAAAYCAWSGKRLLTEPEWEKAARGPNGGTWPWGNEAREHAFNGKAAGVAAPSVVGAFPQSDSPYGVSDMAGNVWQITSGQWDKDGRAMRGGSFLNSVADVRTTVRWSPGDEDTGANWLGFRCGMSPAAFASGSASATQAASTAQAGSAVAHVDRAAVLSVLRGNSKVDDLRVLPPAESKQVARARQSMGVPADEEVLALLNATLSHDGVEGMIFGTRGIYYRTSTMRTSGPSTTFIPYDEFADRRFERNSIFEISLGKGQWFMVAKSGISANQLVDILNQIRRTVRSGSS